MSGTVSRPYESDDLPACLALFDSNVPAFFDPQERRAFQEHLQGAGAAAGRFLVPYLVLVQDGAVVACGGLTVDETRRKAALSWGMVDRRLHGRLLGTHLTRSRLASARSIPGLVEVELSTSQHTHGFYERFGFAVTAVTPHGLGPALDRWDMTLRL